MLKINSIIKENLLKSINEYANDLNHLSFKTMIEEELAGLSKDEEKYKNLVAIHEDKTAIEQLNKLYVKLNDIDTSTAKEILTDGIIRTLEKRNASPKSYELNILLLEHDFEPQFCLCGFDDDNFREQILDRNNYLKFDDTKELFNGIGVIDYSECIKPLTEIEEYLGLEKVNSLESTYVEEVLKLIHEVYYLNTYKILNELFEERRKEILTQKNLNLKTQIHIYANEHDMEERNIFILQN